MLLSILILSLESRRHFLDRLLRVLGPQKTEGVEIILEIDNGENSIGKKRNIALSKATGEYVVYVDDDDLVSEDYVEKILEAIKSKPDCVSLTAFYFIDEILHGLSYHSINHTSWYDKHDKVLRFTRYYRQPGHTNAIRRELALKCPFPEVSWGEDRSFCACILEHLKTESYIVEPIYYYFFRKTK